MRWASIVFCILATPVLYAYPNAWAIAIAVNLANVIGYIEGRSVK